MDCKIEIIPRLLHFKQPAGTSRGVYTTRKVWYLQSDLSRLSGQDGNRRVCPVACIEL